MVRECLSVTPSARGHHYGHKNGRCYLHCACRPTMREHTLVWCRQRSGIHAGASPYVHCRRYAALNPAYSPFTSPLRFTICTAASTTPLYLISPLTCARKRANVSIVGSRDDGQDWVCGASEHNKHPGPEVLFECMHFATHLHLHPQCVERMAHGRGGHSAHRCHHHFLSKRVGRLDSGRRR
jgi:hypothetical protein